MNRIMRSWFEARRGSSRLDIARYQRARASNFENCQYIERLSGRYLRAGTCYYTSKVGSTKDLVLG